MLIYETTGLYRRLSDTHRTLVETSARDGLTGVFNRAYFDDRFPRDFSFASDSDQPLCVLLIDVDHFKQYNDTFGHLAGDDCLRQVASALSTTLRRQSDYAARYGGEEFVAPGPRGTGRTACRTVAQIRDRNARHPVSIPERRARDSIDRSCVLAPGLARVSAGAAHPRRRCAIPGEGARPQPGGQCGRR
jgi:diguanylate cyclase (GGDEF)-like protein